MARLEWPLRCGTTTRYNFSIHAVLEGGHSAPLVIGLLPGKTTKLYTAVFGTHGVLHFLKSARITKGLKVILPSCARLAKIVVFLLPLALLTSALLLASKGTNVNHNPYAYD